MNTRINHFLIGTTIALAIALLLCALPVPARTVSSAPASNFKVSVRTRTDEYNTSGTGAGCSLREAIKSLNDSVAFGGCTLTSIFSGPDEIFLSSGTYTLTLVGADEDLDATGDLDIRKSMTISATGATATIVLGGAGWTDRIFHIITGTVGTVTMKGLTISGGSVLHGGGIFNEIDASLTLIDSTVISNTALSGSGGGVLNLGRLMLNNVTLTGNSACCGGGLYSNVGVATLNNVTIKSNLTYAYGGGIYNRGVMTLTNVTLDDNSTIIGSLWGYGGGIYNYLGELMLTGSSIISNSANRGGGIYSDEGYGDPALTNVTFSDNSAAEYGGGIYVYDDNPILTNVTLNGNSALSGGGLYEEYGTFNLLNTIVANSRSGNNCYAILYGSFNLSSDNSCGFGAGRDNVNVMLGPLGNHGGSTLTHLPLPGSPAIDFGTNAGCPSNDQRGASRPIGKACDVGAVETGYLFIPLVLK